MALSTAIITYDLESLLGDDFVPDSQATLGVRTNIPDETVVDTVGNTIRLGPVGGKITSGSGTVTVWVPGTGSNPDTWQTYIDVTYRSFVSTSDGGYVQRRRLRTFGPFTITTAANLADLVEEQEVPPTYLTTVTTLLDGYVTDAATEADRSETEADRAEAAAADAVDISGISTSDAVVSALIDTVAGPLTQASLSTSIAAQLVAAPPDPQHQRVILFGTSQEAANGPGVESVVSEADNFTAASGRGWADQAYGFLDHQFYTVENAGIGGNRYDQMLARIEADVMAFDSDWVWMGGPANDPPNGRTFDQIKSDLDDMVAIILADGRRLLLLNDAASTSIDTSGERAVLAAVNDYIATLPSVYPGRVCVADAFAAISNQATIQPLTNATFDGTHYSDVGAILIGQRAAEAVRSITPPPLPGIRSAPGRPDLTQLLPNPFLTSSGWSANASLTPSWDIPGQVAVVYAGVTAETDEGIYLTSPLTSGFAPEDKVRLEVDCWWREVEPIADESMIGPNCKVQPRNASDTFTDPAPKAYTTAGAETEIPDRFPTSGQQTIRTAWVELGPDADKLYIRFWFPGVNGGLIVFSNPRLLRKA